MRGILMEDEDCIMLATMHGDEMELCVTGHGGDFCVVANHLIKKK